MPEAKKSERQVAFSMDGFPIKYLGRWMALNGCPGLTETDAEKLLRDKEFVELLMDDLFTYASDGPANGTVFVNADGGFTYADVLNRLNVPHDGILEDDEDDLSDIDPLSDVIEDQNVPD